MHRRSPEGQEELQLVVRSRWGPGLGQELCPIKRQHVQRLWEDGRREHAQQRLGLSERGAGAGAMGRVGSERSWAPSGDDAYSTGICWMTQPPVMFL